MKCSNCNDEMNQLGRGIMCINLYCKDGFHPMNLPTEDTLGYPPPPITFHLTTEDKISRLIADLTAEIDCCRKEAAKLSSKSDILEYWKLKIEIDVMDRSHIKYGNAVDLDNRCEARLPFNNNRCTLKTEHTGRHLSTNDETWHS